MRKVGAVQGRSCGSSSGATWPGQEVGAGRREEEEEGEEDGAGAVRGGVGERAKAERQSGGGGFARSRTGRGAGPRGTRRPRRGRGEAAVWAGPRGGKEGRRPGLGFNFFQKSLNSNLI